MCKSCNAVRVIGKFITCYKEGKQYINKKDANDRIRRKLLYYQNYTDYVIVQNFTYY